jgi:hypothetical protein
MMQELLAQPAVQGLLAPLLAGVVAALVLYPLRLGGLAPACGFFAAVYLTGNLVFEPLNPTRKLVLVAAAAPLLGALADVAFRPTRAAGAVLGIVFGMAAFWVFLGVLGQMPAQRLVLYGVGVAAFVALMVGLNVLSHAEPARAGAAGAGLGLGIGASAWITGSKLFGLLALALGAAAAGFLLVALVLGKRLAAGASFTLSTGVIAGLAGGAAVLLGRLPWYYAAGFVLVPLAVRLPAPHPAVTLVYAAAVACGMTFFVWTAR